ncbi:peptidase S37 tripeptidyl aminopeptidase [Kribbella flavida DSM 17836]|uniref:Peptidase S37 tripeptidyl aminopeptidase n=1 Tax=Kribbella flavida (strain DSM 17836 / JCM 10339 / NBRC 14399) TaxID=479435 RepID=D2PKG8_KRIFD|nr:S28 family serine protease [Kribbella flavida]ADB30480.1 peptidase S37 tripeptidyl aminopeptidase [Kribbella flavida DSM 17836]
MRRFVVSVAAVLVAALTCSLLTPAVAGAAVLDDVAARLATIPGLRIESSILIGERPFFVLRYTQPGDHKAPDGEKFEQRITLWHRDFARPTVLHTTGYGGVGGPFVAEPTRLVDGNQLNVEQRFFNASTPASKDWSKLSIWQAASDHHRIVTAFRKALYPGKWVSTGASKGGMTSVYHRRFYPADVDATVAYVAPHDVVNRQDAYVDFIQGAGTDPQCNLALRNLQRNTLVRRPAMLAKLKQYAAANGLTYDRTFGSADRALEAAVLDTPFAFWQYSTQASCASVPGSATATDQQLFDFIDRIAGWSFYSDEGTAGFLPYFYQASHQLNWPDVASRTTWLKGLLRYREAGDAPAAVPDDIEPKQDPSALRDVDLWLKNSGQRMLFVYGENDPWSAEKFAPGAGTRDSHWYTVPGGNHGASIGGLPAAQRTEATTILQKWMGVAVNPAIQHRTVDPGALRATAR